MRTKCRLLRQKYGQLDLIVVDCLQYVQADIGGMYSYGTETEEISASVRSLKVLAREFECPVLVTCQLGGVTGSRISMRPTSSDLRNCGSVEEDADVVAFVFREDLYFPDDPDRYGKAELIIAKQRNGLIGTVHFAFIKGSTRFEDLANDVTPPDAC